MSTDKSWDFGVCRIKCNFGEICSQLLAKVLILNEWYIVDNSFEKLLSLCFLIRQSLLKKCWACRRLKYLYRRF